MKVAMNFHYSMQIMSLFLLWLLTTAAGAASRQTIQPNCQSICGNINIPYPFGTTPSCYLNPDFLVSCNQTTNQLFLQQSNIQLANISLDGHVQVLNSVAQTCYMEVGMVNYSSVGSPEFLSNFIVSDTRNKLTAVGCDTSAMILGYRGDQRYSTGCMASCNNLNDVVNGSCSGVGCCQISLPRGLKNFTFVISSTFDHVNVWGFNPCDYAFVAEDGFVFTSEYLKDMKKIEKFPLVLDWTIGDGTCQAAQNNGATYLCKSNSTCYDTDNGFGYLCRCKQGYDGNPYIPNGCQDINECGSKNLNRCKYLCTNTEGSYTCSCPKWQRGDGRIGGEGCVPDQTLLMIVVGVCVGIGTLLLIAVSYWMTKYAKKRKIINLKKKYFKRNGGFLLEQQISSDKGKLERSEIFDSEQLAKATDNYNENRVLGKGGQGTVYKGMLIDGSIVAVKRSRKMDEDETQIKQFVNEVAILSQINHKNVVKLLGCCLETEVPLLVYEFISNGTLSSHIHMEEYSINWEDRLRIAKEVAAALAYMHSGATSPIYHRDIKSSNILLDEKFCAKVSDFGISRSIESEKTHFTTAVQGTFGYLDPEYFRSNQYTDKSDVYSYGVVLVELLTGQKPVPSTISEGQRGLVAEFMSSIIEKRMLDFLDPQVVEEGDKEELVLVANLAARCLKLNGKKRPKMLEVALVLDNLRKSVQHLPAELDVEEDDYLMLSESREWDAGWTHSSQVGMSESVEVPMLEHTIKESKFEADM